MAQQPSSARLAQLISSGQHDPEVVYIVTMLQQLGSLLLRYHFPDLALQIRMLMAPSPTTSEDEPEVFGMDELTATQTVLELGLSALSTHVVRQWGLDDSMLLMLMGRLPLDQPVRVTDSDELLRAVASVACEAVHAHTQPSRLYAAAVDRVAQRYGHLLRLDSAKLRAHAARVRRSRGELSPHAGQPPGDAHGRRTEWWCEGIGEPGAEHAERKRWGLTSLTPGTGHNGWGCFVPDLTRLAALPCGEARQRAL